MDNTFELFVGVDWGGSIHQVCILDRLGKVKGQRSFEHSGQALADMCTWLLSFCHDDSGVAAVAIEVPYGPVVETLLDRGFPVFFIHPKQLDRFRDRFSASGAKDDRRDARVAGEAVRTDRAHLRRVDVRDPMAIRLGEWRRILSEVTEESVVLTNRIRSQLWRYYPAFLEVAGDLSAAWIIALWALTPTPAAAASVSQIAVNEIFKDYPVRRFTAESVLIKLRQPAPIVAPGTVEAAETHCRVLFERLRLALAQKKEAQREIDALITQWDSVHYVDPRELQTSEALPSRGDVEILSSFPGIGRVVLSTLLSEAGDLVKDRDYHRLRLRAGTAPVTRQSGKTKHVVRRRACSRPLRDAVYNWARVTCLNKGVSSARYRSLREKGHSHGRALRTIGDRLLAVACAMLKCGTLFDPQRAQTIAE